MKDKLGYLVLIIPLLEEDSIARSLWLRTEMKQVDGESCLTFDWTSEIRETVYFETKERAEKIAGWQAQDLQPRFCEVVALDQRAIDFLGISKDKTPENPRLHEN